MKKIFVLVFAVLLLFSGCASKKRTDVTPEEIVAAYENTGYNVSIIYYDEKIEHGQIGYIQANHPDGDYIYFSIFETEEEAKAYKKEFYHPGILGLFSVIFGDPSFPRWEVYRNIVIQYDDPAFFEPFEELLKSS